MTGRWRRLLARLGYTLSRRARPADLDDEFQSHMDHAAADFERQGYSAADARRLAAVRFGSQMATREAVHEARGLPSLERAWTDLRYAARSLLNRPGNLGGRVL